MNVYDANKIATLLKVEGYSQVSSPFDADVVILYTCHIREKAIQKVYSDIGKIKKFNLNERQIIALGGCMAQQLGSQILQKNKDVHIVFGPQNIQELPQLLSDFWANNKRIVSNTFDVIGKFNLLNNLDAESKISTYLTIQEGCDNFCTYCVVPYTRGREYSRKAKDIIVEAKKLVDLGAKEITLLGQNVDAYCDKGEGKICRLEDLIYELSLLNGLERIRYMSPNPQNLTDELIAAHTNIKKLMPNIHVPAQSGSNPILKKMNRPYTREQYLDLINKIREKCQDIALSSDFIVGFPSETEEDFQQTLELVKTVKYSNAFYFKYSRRPGTPADKMLDQIPEEIKNDRFEKLDILLKNQQESFNKSFLNKTVEVLVEEQDQAYPISFGKTRHNISCCIKNPTKGKIKPGDLVKVKILKANLKSLIGEI